MAPPTATSRRGRWPPAKLVPEGIEGRVPYKGPVADVLYQMVGGLRSGMGYCGVSSIGQLRCDVEMIQITSAGLRESHPHDVTITTGSAELQRLADRHQTESAAISGS